MKALVKIESVLMFLLLIILGSVGCSGLAPGDTSTPTALPATATARPSRTAQPTATASPIPPSATPSRTPTPAPLSPSAIFDRTAPAIAYIETALGSGSAILIEGDYLLTNAHVVWPYDSVRAVFPDGSEYEGVPLVGWDLLTDLALLGPLPEVAVEPLPLMDGEASVVGSDVYLVGYPGEVEAYPQATITRGLISRRREWETAGITFFQTDAMITGGQSGGALVSEMGDVIGLSGFSFAASEFGLVASARDLQPHVEKLLKGKSDAKASDPLIDREKGSKSHTFKLRDSWNAAVFIVESACDTPLEVEAESEQDITLQVVNFTSGEVSEVDETVTGGEWLSVSLSPDSVYLVAVYQFYETVSTVTLESSCSLIPIRDREDQRTLLVDEVTRGSLDYPGDFDIFHLNLQDGEVVNLFLDSASIDPYLRVTYPDASWDTAVEDDDSGGGLFGLDADLTFRAPHSDRFLVVVGDANGNYSGGYSLTVSSNRSGAPTPVALPPTPTPLITDYGAMRVYESARYPFTMQIPATWEDTTAFEENCAGTCFSGDDGFLVVVEEDVVEILGEAGQDMTREQYNSLVRENALSFLPTNVSQSRQTLTTEGGFPSEVVHYRWSEGGTAVHMKSVIAFEEGIGFNAIYVVPDEAFAELEGMIDYSFSTLQLAP